MLRRFVIVFIVGLLVFVAMLTQSIDPIYGQGGPQVEQPTVHPHSSDCGKDMGFHLKGFAPNSPITVTSSYSETVCATGQVVTSGWTSQLGTTDGNGEYWWYANHAGTGSYDFQIHDGKGNSIHAKLVTSSNGSVASWQTTVLGGQPQPTPVPIQPTNPPSRPPFAQAQLDNGGVHFQKYCAAKYAANEYREMGNALSWSCMKDSNRIPLNFDQVCQDVWGNARPIMVISDMNAAGSLSCQATGQGGYSTNMGGSSPQTPQPDSSCGKALPPNIQVGQRARVTHTDGTPNNLRAQPGKTSSIIAKISGLWF